VNAKTLVIWSLLTIEDQALLLQEGHDIPNFGGKCQISEESIDESIYVPPAAFFQPDKKKGGKKGKNNEPN